MDEMTTFLVFTLVIAASIGVAGLLWARSVVVRMTDIETTLDKRFRGTVPLPTREALHAWRVETSEPVVSEHASSKKALRNLLMTANGFDSAYGHVSAEFHLEDDFVQVTYQVGETTTTFVARYDLRDIERTFLRLFEAQKNGR